MGAGRRTTPRPRAALPHRHVDGSLGTFRLGLLYPDLWARALGVGNYTNPFCVTVSQEIGCAGLVAPFNYFDILENARNVPWGLVNGTLDELTPASGVREIADRFEDLGHRHVYWEYLTRRHEPSLHGLTTDVTDPFLDDGRRAARPAIVDYTVERAMQNEAWGLIHDRAYWVRDIRLGEGRARGKVVGVDHRGVFVPIGPRLSGGGTSAAGPYVLRGLDERDPEQLTSNFFFLNLTGVSALTVDADAAGFLRSEELRYAVDTDEAVTITVTGWGTFTAALGQTSTGAFVP